MNDIEHYTLTCEKCEEAYYSKEGFPSPQICPECLMREKLADILLQVFNNGFVLGEVGVGDDMKSTEWALSEILSLETKTHRIAVIKKGEPPVLTPDGQQTALKTARQNSGGKILSTVEMYDAIAKAQKKLSDEFYKGD